MDIAEVSLRDSGSGRGHFAAGVLLTCERCKQSEPGRHPCRIGTRFRWQHNSHLQLNKPVNSESLLLVDQYGIQHILRVATGRPSAPENFRKWRSSYLKSLLGRRPLPERAVTPASPLAIHNDVDPPQFAWDDNFHLLRDDFLYLMRAPSRNSWDMKVLDFIDTSGRHHILNYGLGAIEGCRVEKWRTQTIDNVLRSFRVVFGMAPGLVTSSARDLEEIVRTYDPSAATVSLRRLIDQLQTVMCARTPSSLRLEVAGPNFFNFFLTVVTNDSSLRRHFLRLNWTERVDRPFSRQSRLELLHGLVKNHVRNYQGKALSLPGHLHQIWIMYCNYLLDTSFLEFRKKVIAHKKTWKLLEQFAEPENKVYKWGDLERARHHSA